MLKLNKLYNMDCMEGMKEIPDKYFELAIVDPPYGDAGVGGGGRHEVFGLRKKDANYKTRMEQIRGTVQQVQAQPFLDSPSCDNGGALNEQAELGRVNTAKKS